MLFYCQLLSLFLDADWFSCCVNLVSGCHRGKCQFVKICINRLFLIAIYCQKVTNKKINSAREDASMVSSYYKISKTIYVSRECEWNSRVEGKQPLRHPRKSDAVVIPASIPGGLFHLLRADPNVVLSLKTEATTPHYRLRVRLYSFSASLYGSSVSPSPQRGSRFNPHVFCILGSFSASLYPPFFISLVQSHSTPAGHNTRYP